MPGQCGHGAIPPRRGLSASRFKPTPLRRASLPAARLNCVRADAGKSVATGHQKAASPCSGSRVAAIHGRRRRPRCQHRVRAAAALQHNVALRKVPHCHAACASCSAAWKQHAGKQRASTSLRVTHVHVGGRPGAARRGSTAPSIVVLRRGHPWPRSFGDIAALRVDRLPSLRSVHRHALARVLRTPAK